MTLQAILAVVVAMPPSATDAFGGADALPRLAVFFGGAGFDGGGIKGIRIVVAVVLMVAHTPEVATATAATKASVAANAFPGEGSTPGAHVEGSTHFLTWRLVAAPVQ
jgi:hypothetical protein